MNWIWKYVYVDKLDDIVNKYNSTYHSTNKMMPFYACWSQAYILTLM